jgi:protein O-mannosyl-transferase
MNWRTWLICLLLIVGTVGIFLRVTRNSFVDYDDPVYITRNPHVQRGLTPAGIGWAFTTTDAANWHPLTWLSHMLDVDGFGNDPAAHHLISVVIHAVSGALLFLALFRMTGATWCSAFAAAVFAVHPLRVESVAWAAERKDVLAALFWMLTLLAYRSYVVRPTIQRYILVALYLLLGLLAKPMLVTLPFVLLLLDIWPLRRIQTHPWRVPRRVIVEKLPLLALAGASCVVTYVAQHRGGALAASESAPISLKFANATVGIVRYIGKIFWPTKLAVLYPLQPHIPGTYVLAAGGILIIITLMAIALLRSRPYVAVGWFWFLGTLVPVIGIVQAGNQAIADRYTYIPSIGLLICVSWGVADVAARWRFRSPMLALGSAAVLIVLCWLTWVQIGHWKNTMTLFAHALNVTSDNYIAHSYVGSEYAKLRNLDQADAEFRNAIAIKPVYAEAHFNLANCLAERGAAKEAIAEYEKAIESRPGFAEAYLNLGRLYAASGQMELATVCFARAVVHRPDYVEAHESFGQALLALGDVNGAITQFRDALSLRPDSLSIKQKLDRALLEQKKLRSATAPTK